MKKSKLLPVDQVTEAIRKEFDNPELSCIGAYNEHNPCYQIKTATGEILVTKKQQWERTYGQPVIEEEQTAVFNFQGEIFMPLIAGKEFVARILICCGLKQLPELAKPKVLKMWEMILQVPELHLIFMRKLKDSDAKSIASDYQKLIEYTQNIYDNFTSCTVTVTETEIKWLYYKGAGKTFAEGRAKIAIDLLAIIILVPELEKLAAMYNRVIVKNLEQKMIA